MERFLTSAIPVYIMLAVTVLGIIGTWITGIYYRQMIKQTENMMNIHHALILQIKNKFENTYRVNRGIRDIPLFVEKQLNSKWILGLTPQILGKASQKASIVCLIFGCGITVLQQIHYFSAWQVIRSLGITMFFALLGMGVYYLSDMEARREQVRVQLTEYFSNTFAKRVAQAGKDEAFLAKESSIQASAAEPDKNIEKLESRAERRKFSRNKAVENEISEENGLTEADLQYLRQSLERIAAGRDRSLKMESAGEDEKKSIFARKTEPESEPVKNTGRQHSFSAKDGKLIEDILNEYF